MIRQCLPSTVRFALTLVLACGVVELNAQEQPSTQFDALRKGDAKKQIAQSADGVGIDLVAASSNLSAVALELEKKAMHFSAVPTEQSRRAFLTAVVQHVHASADFIEAMQETLERQEAAIDRASVDLVDLLNLMRSSGGCAADGAIANDSDAIVNLNRLRKVLAELRSMSDVYLDIAGRQVLEGALSIVDSTQCGREQALEAAGQKFPSLERSEIARAHAQLVLAKRAIVLQKRELRRAACLQIAAHRGWMAQSFTRELWANLSSSQFRIKESVVTEKEIRNDT